MTTLDVIVPAYQEVANLEPAVLSVLSASADDASCRTRVIIVDDGSTDGTSGLADRLAAAHPQVKVIHQPNQGIGGAIQAGLGAAGSEFVMIWPADMRMNRDLYSRFARRFSDADVLVGFRRARTGYSAFMKLNSWVFASAIRCFCGIRLRDVTWISVYRSSLLRGSRPQEKGVAVLPELLLLARKAGATFAEIGLEMQPRVHGSASAAKFKTMVRALFGLMRLCARFNRFNK